jgi:hypothetical protein
LYLALYAADEDIESHAEGGEDRGLDDRFRMTFYASDVDYVIEVSPRGLVIERVSTAGGGRVDPSWRSGAHVSSEIDGTLNEPSDADEEWLVEMAVPFESLGMRGERGESIGFSVRRCDSPKHAVRTCATWGELPRGRIVLR